MTETLDPMAATEVDQKQLAEQLLAQAKEQGVELMGPNGLLNQLTKNVLETVRRVRDKGIAVVLISHSMPAVLEVADRIQVMRLGTRVATLPAQGTTVEELVGAMTGALDTSSQGAVR